MGGAQITAASFQYYFPAWFPVTDSASLTSSPENLSAFCLCVSSYNLLPWLRLVCRLAFIGTSALLPGSGHLLLGSPPRVSPLPSSKLKLQTFFGAIGSEEETVSWNCGWHPGLLLSNKDFSNWSWAHVYCYLGHIQPVTETHKYTN